MQEATQEQAAKPVLYAVIELFGHARVAGAVSEQNFGGANLIRVDVPEVTFTRTVWDEDEKGYRKDTRTIAAHTRSLGGGSVYAINWCDEETARVAAHSIHDEPLEPYSVRKSIDQIVSGPASRMLPAGRDADEEDRDQIPY